jgi:hypothetical protein
MTKRSDLHRDWIGLMGQCIKSVAQSTTNQLTTDISEQEAALKLQTETLARNLV